MIIEKQQTLFLSLWIVTPHNTFKEVIMGLVLPLLTGKGIHIMPLLSIMFEFVHTLRDFWNKPAFNI
jgi:hypothetical protein